MRGGCAPRARAVTAEGRGGLIFVSAPAGATARLSSFSLYFFIPDARWLLPYSARSAALT